ncbi:septum site-determining protein MinC [Roseococcus sp. SYP-B2431]|uniref:septum site-determining protein MinC n=1 Tax=Roseococcus sp. SYP-B2431 TaxID=2496640 RepID=UPI00103B42E5|nr:septum site-determining protein MinC [Roseococcus sp. SYP-B2431]TCH97196.1 septum site-determining protein MinC [Roseococcus sp. SYP-B2431]
MSATARPASPPETFRLRASNYSLLTLRLLTGDVQAVLPALGDQFRKAPGFLRFAPIAIGLDDLGGEQVDFPALIQGLRALEILPIGVVGGAQPLRAAAAGAGLPTLRPAGQRETEVEAPSPVGAPPVNMAPAPAPEAPRPAMARSMMITQNIRAGQRIYAQGSDLIVVGSVNAGSEVIADGNIHIYGSLRGRAVAGASEDAEARIFAQNFDPELVAISGFYAVREGLSATPIGRGVQVRLDGEQLRFDPLG